MRPAFPLLAAFIVLTMACATAQGEPTTVSQAPTPGGMTAVIGATRAGINAGLTFEFTSAESTPLNGIASAAWDFGDGNTVAGHSASHTYMAAGEYTVTLTVNDGLGGSAVATTRVEALDPFLPEWSRTVDSPGTDGFLAVATGPVGTIYAVGSARGEIDGEDEGIGRALIAAYSTDGQRLWTRTIQDEDHALEAVGVAALDSRIFVLINWLPLAADTPYLIELRPLNAATGADAGPRWTQSLGNGRATGLALSASGMLAVAGVTCVDVTGMDRYGQYECIDPNVADHEDMALWTVSSASMTTIGQATIGTAGADDVAHAVAFGANDRVYVGGYSYDGSSTTPRLLAYDSVSLSGEPYEYALEELPGAVIRALVVGTSGIYIGGSVPGDDSWSDAFVSRVTNNGVQWTRRLESTTLANSGEMISQSIAISGMALHPNGGVVGITYARHAIEGNVVAGPVNFNGAIDDIVLGRYTAEGEQSWVTMHGKPYEDIARGVAVLPNGRTVVVGETDDGRFDGDRAGLIVLFPER